MYCCKLLVAVVINVGGYWYYLATCFAPLHVTLCCTTYFNLDFLQNKISVVFFPLYPVRPFSADISLIQTGFWFNTPLTDLSLVILSSLPYTAYYINANTYEPILVKITLCVTSRSVGVLQAV